MGNVDFIDKICVSFEGEFFGENEGVIVIE